MNIVARIRDEILEEWGDLEPQNLYKAMHSHKDKFNLGCFFSIDDINQKEKIVFAIANLSSDTYKVMTLISVDNVQLVERMAEVTRELFPDFTFNEYREMIFFMLEEIVKPVLDKYHKKLPVGITLVEDGNHTNIDGEISSLSYNISLQDVPLNKSIESIIEDVLKKTSKA